MREKKLVGVEKEIIIKCDKCGCKIDSFDHMEEYISIDYDAGFGAKYFNDCDHVSIDLCEKCFYEFIRTLKNVRIRNRLTDEPDIGGAPELESRAGL